MISKRRNLRMRARMIRAIRSFFSARDYLDVETPLLASAPIPEPHIDFVETTQGVLLPSPEVYMKRLLAAGYPRIFQIVKCFRDGERGERHLPEFTLLEWYRAGADYRGLMEECEDLVKAVIQDLGMGPSLTYQGKEIRLNGPWQRITVAEAFDRYAGEPSETVLSEGRFDEVLVSRVEPRLGSPRPSFLRDYPAEMASLSRLRQDDPTVCERVELYLGGLEIANGFSELVDADEQRRRFEKEAKERSRLGRTAFPLPEAFLRDLAHMPPAAGIALGVDRLAMVLADAGRIDEVVTFTPEDG